MAVIDNQLGNNDIQQPIPKPSSNSKSKDEAKEGMKDEEADDFGSFNHSSDDKADEDVHKKPLKISENEGSSNSDKAKDELSEGRSQGLPSDSSSLSERKSAKIREREDLEEKPEGKNSEVTDLQQRLDEESKHQPDSEIAPLKSMTKEETKLNTQISSHQMLM